MSSPNKRVCALMISAIALRLHAQDVTRDRTVPTVSVKAHSFIGALIQVASQFELPLAVEWIQSPDALKPVDLTRNDINASGMFDAVVSAHPGYSWTFENGVVHVFQESIANDPRNPLNVRLDAIAERSWTLPDADNYLFGLVAPIVRHAAPKEIAGTPPSWGEPQFSLASSRGPVHEILDRLITCSKMKIWIATFPEVRPLNSRGFWEVTPMYDPKYVRPENQPFWILLRWGDAPWKRLENPER